MVMIPLAYAVEECQRITYPKDIPCNIISSWDIGECSGTLFIYNGTGDLLQQIPWGNYTPVCNVTFNITELGVYYYNSSIEDGVINVEADEQMIGLGVIIFLILLNLALFIGPFKINFTDDAFTNNIIKKGVWLLGLAILALNTTILIDLAETAALGITDELFTFHWFFVKGIYIFMIILFANIMLSSNKILKAKKERIRMGEA